MKAVCPECSGEVEVDTAPAKVLSGECAACGHGITILEGVRPPAAKPGAEAPGTEAGEEGGAESAGLVCAECGETAAVRAAADGKIETECSGCGAEAVYALVGGEAEEETPEPRRPERRSAPPGRGGFDRPASRPCRECGGTLQFRDGPDGGVIGECSSCGNRFTLPPRRDRDGPERRGRPPYGGRPERRSSDRPFRRGGDWRGRGERRTGGPRGGSRPYRRRDGDGAESDDRRRRRRRDDE